MSRNLLSEIFLLSKDVITAGLKTGTTVATAESCTGGLIGAAITATPGSSTVFHGGIIAYHNSVKINQLAVEKTAIDGHGAVSEIVAKQMAQGCRERLNVDIAVSVTGVAIEKPVGTVWIGLAHGDEVTAKLHNFQNQTRNKVRDYTCLAALETVLKAMN